MRVLDVVEVLDVLDFSAPLSSDSASANPSSSGSGMRSITLLASEVIGFARLASLRKKPPGSAFLRSKKRGKSVSDGFCRASFCVFAVPTLAVLRRSSRPLALKIFLHCEGDLI